MAIETTPSTPLRESHFGWWLRGVLTCAVVVLVPTLVYAFTVGSSIDMRFQGYLALTLGYAIVFLGLIAYPLLSLAFAWRAPDGFKASAVAGVLSLPVLTMPVIVLLAYLA